ncbi:subtilisin-like protease SBT3 [Prosopis cineraria]|uniref:subtilisin-like protease SBT3 n=1 Tax=Prosopis cineraria TaxID=364024 RepID=UPI00240FCEA3|nr:subtilisin-like protease SBT3 [Prosopis cineraria]
MVTHGCLYLWMLYIITVLSCLGAALAQSDNYIVHMDLSAMPKAFSTRHHWYLATLASATSDPASPSSKLIYSYSHVMNGFSARLSASELNALKNSPGYVSSFPDSPVKLDTTRSPQFLRLNPLAGAWPESDYGKDVIVGLVDSGVWPESQSYNDDGMSEIPSRWKGKCENGTQFNSSLCNKKLIGARFFNKGLLAKNPNVTISMNSARDTEGHGTHTSTTAVGSRVEGSSYFGYASGTATGVAPRARVAIYKAFWEDETYQSDVIAAIDGAIEDGVDVLSLSFGFDETPMYEDPVAIATFAAMEKGVFVSASAGNDGPGLRTLHNGTPWVITVAASTLDREFLGVLTLGNRVPVTGRSLYVGNFPATQLPLVFMGSCDSLKKLIKVRSKIVVCEDTYENSTLLDQMINLDKAKVSGGVFISNNQEITIALQFSDIPTIFVSPENGEVLKDYISKSKSPKASLKFKITSLGTTRAPIVDFYSSRGPSQSCPFVLKPDVTAPGTLILAAWPPNIPIGRAKSKNLFGNFNLVSGTSMSCPHVAGIAALIKGVHRDWSPAAIRSAIMTSSDLVDNDLGIIRDRGHRYEAASPLAMGAGHVNPDKALDPGLVYDAGTEDYVNLLCALNYTVKNIKAVTRSSSHNCSSPSLDLNYPSFIAFFNPNDTASTVREFQRTVTNVGEGPSIYQPSITPIEGLNVSVIPSVLVFADKNEKLSYKLRIEGLGVLKDEVAFGQLIWSDKTHSVRSPIVVTSLSSKPKLSH